VLHLVLVVPLENSVVSGIDASSRDPHPDVPILRLRDRQLVNRTWTSELIDSESAHGHLLRIFPYDCYDNCTACNVVQSTIARYSWAMLTEDRLGAWMNLGQTAHVIQALLEERLQEAVGLSGVEFELLWRLRATADRRLRMSEIASQLLASKSGITRIVARLEADGLLVRKIPADNRRVVWALLTAKGEGAVVSGQAAFAVGLEETFSAHLSDTEVKAMRRILRKLLECNGAWAEDRCSPAFAEMGGEKAG
jgi:DNA-binding MarR family transcriptional regulator